MIARSPPWLSIGRLRSAELAHGIQVTYDRMMEMAFSWNRRASG
jgi:hypothetical protein